MELKCLVTGNPCGTDTWIVGRSCKCINCQRYILLLGMEEQVKRFNDRQNKMIELLVQHSVAYHCEDWETMHKATEELLKLLEG